VHEIGVCEGLLAAVERRAAGRQVARVRFRAGVLHRIVEPALQQAFELVSAGTVADGAVLDLVTLPVAVRCRTCRAETVADDMVSVCGTCGATDLDLVGGDELMLESLEIAAPV
jgi:hydrogenase nickel incorporation protein HypA/HybF